jgi:hypothetical protein
MPQRESAIVGRNNVRAQVTGQEELLVKVNSIDPGAEINVNVHDALGNDITSTTIGPDTGLDVNIIGGVTLEVNLDAANDQVGIYGYVNGASGSPVPLNTNASGQVAIQDGGNSITVDGGTGVSRTPNAIRPTNTSGTVTGTIYSISVANVGAANGTVLASLTVIKPGEVLNFSADAINNFFTSFDYNATGTEFIIIYVS